MTEQRAPIVVGVDGSAAGRGALRWAADEAVRYDRPLTVVHILEVPRPLPVRTDRLGTVHRAADLARAVCPGLAVQTTVMFGAAGPVLCESAKNAARLVVGSHGLGTHPGAHLGSVAAYLGTRAPCPLLLVYGSERWARPQVPLSQSGPIVLGVGGFAAAHRAVRLAFGEAAARHVPLVTIQVLPEGTPLDQRTGQAMQLRTDLAHWQPVFPTVRVDSTVALGDPVTTLVQAARTALMVVLGTHGNKSVGNVRLGSVTQQLVLHLCAPVLIVYD